MPNSCQNAELYLAANTNTITCSSPDSCQGIQIICGLPAPNSLPPATTMTHLDGEITSCLLQTSNNSINTDSSFTCAGNVKQCQLSSTGIISNLKNTEFTCNLYDDNCILDCHSAQSCGYDLLLIEPTLIYYCRGRNCKCYNGCWENTIYDTSPDISYLPLITTSNTPSSTIFVTTSTTGPHPDPKSTLGPKSQSDSDEPDPPNIDLYVDDGSTDDSHSNDDEDTSISSSSLSIIIVIVAVLIIVCMICGIFYYKRQATQFREDIEVIKITQKNTVEENDAEEEDVVDPDTVTITVKSEGHKTDKSSTNNLSVVPQPGQQRDVDINQIGMHKLQSSEGVENITNNTPIAFADNVIGDVYIK